MSALSSLLRRRAAAPLLAVGLLGGWLAISCSPGDGERSDGVTLTLSTEHFSAETEFEVRFATPTAAPGDIGRRIEPAPLVIVPALPGSFVWTSTRTGTYRPSVPPRLDTTYLFRLRSNLTAPDGTAHPARLRRTLTTPGFGFRESRIDHSRSNAPARPEIGLNFNADVLAQAVQAYVVFRDARGRTVQARVTQATEADSFETSDWSTEKELQTWIQQFVAHDQSTSSSSTAAPSLAHSPIRPHLRASVGAEPPGPALVSNRVFVTPVIPLPPGSSWRLAIDPGLPSADRTLRLRTRQEVKWGDVAPFTVKAAVARQGLHSGRRIVITFSKAVAELDNKTRLHSLVAVHPAPTNLTTEIDESMVVLEGAFQLNTNYTVTIAQDLPGADGSALAEAWHGSVRFEPLPPRLYFPTLTGEQIASGKRTFEIQTVNSRPIRVRARRLDRHTLIHAIRGYQRYEKANGPQAVENDEDEPYREIDFDGVPGKMIYDETLSSNAPVDDPGQLQLSWDRILGPGRPGAVFLTAEQELDAARGRSDARRRRQGAQALLQITDLGLAWKAAGSNLTVLVLSHRSGRPLQGAALSLLTDDNVTLSSGVSGPDGSAVLAVETNALWLMAELGDDLHAVRLQSHDLWPHSYGLTYDWRRTSGTDAAVFFFTDRPVYRPGETVHLKAIARRAAAEDWALPAGEKAGLNFFNGRNEVFLRTNLIFSALGSADFSLALPEDGRGQYRAELLLGTREHEVHFHVGDFQANAFSVQLGNPPVLPPGAPLRAPLSATYFSGAPVTRAKVVWTATISDDPIEPDGLDGFLFGTDKATDPRLGRNQSGHVIHGESVFHSRSNLVLEPPVAFNPAAPGPRRVALRAEVTDLNQQTISQTAGTLCHSSSFYLGLRRIHGIIRAGQPLPLLVTAVQPDGRPLERKVPVTVRLDQLQHRTVRVEGAGRAHAYQSELNVTNVFSRETHTAVLQRAGSEWVARPGDETTLTMPHLEPGHYLLEARTEDEAGRAVVAACTLFVQGGADSSWWDYRNAHQLELVADQPSYTAGQTAQILVQAPFAGTAWVTLERDRVRRSWVVPIEAGAPTIPVPLEDGDAPNVVVSVLLQRGSADSLREFPMPEYRLGFRELLVANPRKRLHIEITTAEADYRPGARVQVTSTVTDDAGRPVPGAEVTLYAVDEGVLSLTDASMPDPHSVFSQLRALTVRTGLSLPSLLPEDPAQLSFGNKGYLVGGGGGSLARRVRRDFLPCAYWNAALITDGEGRVSAAFSAPDSLTRYRVMAIAHDGRSRFGSQHSSFQVNKPLMIDPPLPRFAHVGDQLLARAVVQNLTTQSVTVEVNLRLDHTASTRGSPSRDTWRRTVPLPAQGAVAVDFPVELKEPGTAKWIWSARRARRHQESGSATIPEPESDFIDSAESTLVVEHTIPLMREMRFGVIDSPETNLLGGFAPHLLEGQGTVVVNIATSRLAELGDAPEQLLVYPYGCVEQTSSSLLPWLVLRRSPGLAPSLERRLKESGKIVAAGVHRLLSMQTASGGLSYWPGGTESMPWGSAYAAVILALAQRDGCPIPEGRLEKLWKYLSASLRERDGFRPAEDREAHGLALYALALAGRGEPAYHELLLRDRGQLTPALRALLALAMFETGAPSTDISSLLATRGSAVRTGHHWFGSTARDQAMELLAELRLDPAGERASRRLAEVIQERRQGHWGTTQGNAWALLALAEYAARLETNVVPTTIALTCRGTPETHAFADRTGNVRRRFDFGPGQPIDSLYLTKPEGRRLFTQVTVESRPLSSPELPMGDALRITRTYAKLDDDGVLHPPTDLQVGDRVLVTLEVSVREPSHFVAVDDPLPAVLEPIRVEFKSQATSHGASALQPSSQTLHWPTSHHEIRVDRALFFGDHVETPGRYEIRYLARVRAAGTAIAPAAQVAAMYRPERIGFSQPTTVIARPLLAE